MNNLSGSISPTFIIAVVIVALIVWAIKNSVFFVPQGYYYVVEHLGKYKKTLGPGWHVIIPFVNTVSARVNMQEQVFDVPSQDVITKDNAMVAANGIVFYQIVSAARAVYEVSDLEDEILKLTLTNIHGVMGAMNLDKLLSKHDEINAQLLNAVNRETPHWWGVKVTRIEMKDIRAC